MRNEGREMPLCGYRFAQKMNLLTQTEYPKLNP